MSNAVELSSAVDRQWYVNQLEHRAAGSESDGPKGVTAIRGVSPPDSGRQAKKQQIIASRV